IKTATVALVRRHIEAQHGRSGSRLHPWPAPNWVEGKFYPEIAAEHMGENRPIGSRARPLAVRSAMREPWAGTSPKDSRDSDRSTHRRRHPSRHTNGAGPALDRVGRRSRAVRHGHVWPLAF